MRWINLSLWPYQRSLSIKISFPDAVYRNKNQFNKNIYWNWYSKYWTIFNIFTSGIEIFVISYVCIFGYKGASTSQVIGARNEMIMVDYDGQMIFGDLVGLSFLTFVLQVRKKPEKTSPRKLVPTGDRTQARSVTGAHDTTCSTSVDICHTVGPTFVSCVIEVCRLGLQPLCDTHLRLSVILKTLTLTG